MSIKIKKNKKTKRERMFNNFSVFNSLEYEFVVESESSSEESEYEIINISEIESKNKKLINEKDIKYELYPLYINWKKIETKSLYNPYFNIFKVFGYLGAAIYNILLEIYPHNEYFFKCKNLLRELFNIYKKDYTKKEIEENEFFKKLLNIYENIISLIKNKIIIFKEISILLVIMKLYETYFITIENKEKLLEILKYQYIILSYINNNEYKKIYYIFFRKINSHGRRYLSKNKHKFRPTKKEDINYIKDTYKLTKEEIKEEK